jgi:hypothetical protein
MDCGLLIEPWEVGKKKWTICKLCSEVYTKTEHQWLSKMLAEHLSDLVKTRKHRANKKYTVFMCNKCGGYFIDFETAKRKQKTCKWCNLIIGKKTKVSKTCRCIICHRQFISPKRKYRLVCQTCLPALENIKKALKYTYYIMWRTKKAETRMKNCARISNKAKSSENSQDEVK